MKFVFKFFLILTSLLISLSLSGFAQIQKSMKTDFEITKIEPAYVKTPNYSISIGPQKRSTSKDWLEVEAEFSWQPRTAQESKYTDELTFTYYILLNNASQKNPQGTLLVGQVTHVAIAADKGMKSVMYVSPRSLERFFDGKVPPTAQTAIKDVGVTITKQGQLVAFEVWKGNGPWWNNFQQTQGYVLNKNETPFAPLYWDYYEAIKSRTPGL